jgi:hypothetical protein
LLVVGGIRSESSDKAVAGQRTRHLDGSVSLRSQLPSTFPPTMENELTFVAPEGVYSVTEDHRPIPAAHNAPLPIYPSRLSTITVRFPATRQPAIQGLGQLLGGGKDFWKEKGLAPASAKDDGASVSSGETPEDATAPDAGSPQDATAPTSMAAPDQNHGLFSPPVGGKRRALSRPKHNMRTTSSTFITRVHCVEGLAKALQAKQGEVTYLFYNSAKHVYWAEAGVQSKVRIVRYAFAKSLNPWVPPCRKL